MGTPFGRPQLGAKVELARHELSLGPELLHPIRLPIHERYDFSIPETPVIKVEEAVSEKLARYRQVSLVRDLYDLQWYATAGAMDEPLVRRLWVLKVFRDIVIDGRGTKPIDASDVLEVRTAKRFRPEDIGYLTRPIKIDEWIATVRSRYYYLAALTEQERRWAECNERDRHEVVTALRRRIARPTKGRPTTQARGPRERVCWRSLWGRGAGDAKQAGQLILAGRMPASCRDWATSCPVSPTVRRPPR